MSSSPAHGRLYLIQHYAMEFISDLSMVFSGTPVSSTNKTDRHNITDTVESGIKHNNSDPKIIFNFFSPGDMMMTPQRKSANRNGSVGRYDHKPQYPVRSGDIKIQLPVDEDDYLQPKSSHQRKYMDLLDGAPGKGII